MPHALSDMSSSPAQKPGSPVGKELLDKKMRKFKIVNRFVQFEDALIKPGEDALDLHDRTQYRRNTPQNTTAATRFPKRQCPRRAGTSISSEHSATSYASSGSNSTASGSSNSSGSSLASLIRHTNALRIPYSRPDYSTRQQPQCRSDANAGYIPHASEENVSEMASIPVASATASTAITTPHPGIDHAASRMQPL